MALGQFIQGGVRRAYRSPVIWLWAFYGLRVASGLITLPIVLRVLTASDLGMFYVFASITAILPIIDFGFTPTVTRFVSYATAGATELQAQGVPSTERHLPPNKALLWRLLFTYRKLYRLLALVAFVLLALWGTWNVNINAAETSSLRLTWSAWGVTLLAAVVEIYAGWWNTFLRGMNEVLLSARLAVLGYVLQLILACAMLLLGFGLLSLPLASLVGSLLQRSLSRVHCLRLLEPKPIGLDKHGDLSLLRIVWPNTWRLGIQHLSIYLGTKVPQLIFAAVFGTAVYSRYGLTVQIVGLCSAMASVWTLVRWPLVAQLQSRADSAALQRVVRPASRLQVLTYCVLAVGAVATTPWVLAHIGSHKEVVATKWFILLAVTAFLDLRFAFWTTLLSTANRVPFLWPTVATNLVILATLVGLWATGELDLWALVIVPLIIGAAFNYWYWPLVGAKSLCTSWWSFAFGRGTAAHAA
jgi:O-antigen/teichoic acid export membrane protein